MQGAPGPHPAHMHGAAEVVLVVRFGKPRGLAGGLAGALAIRFGAVPLPFSNAPVNIKKYLAAQALTLSRLSHGHSSNGSRNATPSATRTPSRGSLKKTDSAPKKTRQRLSLEEHGSGRKCIFTPAEIRQIRVGGHTAQRVLDTHFLVCALVAVAMNILRLTQHEGRWVLGLGANDSAHTMFERLYKQLSPLSAKPAWPDGWAADKCRREAARIGPAGRRFTDSG
jgi:hypothetical protein